MSGQHLANDMSIYYADSEIINQAAKQLSVLKEDVESRDEKILSFWQSFIQSFALAPETFVPKYVMPPSERKLFKIESEIIKRIANERSTVIIGRCGSYVLREHPNHISIFLHGNKTFRINRVQNLLHVSEEAAEYMIVRSDKERTIYHRTMTGKEWTDARRYNISIDTSKIGVDKSVELILKYVELI